MVWFGSSHCSTEELRGISEEEERGHLRSKEEEKEKRGANKALEMEARRSTRLSSILECRVESSAMKVGDPFISFYR